MGIIENETNYKAKDYRTPDGAPSDIVIFTITTKEKNNAKKALPERTLQVLLIQRKKWPFEGCWALPGGFCEETESMYDCARRELEEETSVTNIHMEYYNVYSKPGRDPRGWMISHAFFALVNESLLQNRSANDDAADVRLVPIEEALQMNLAFDHKEVLMDAWTKVQEKMLTTTIAKEFLAETFTISELYHIIQTVVPHFQEKNFIRKITSTQSRKGIIEEAIDEHGAPMSSNQYSQRAAQLYRFTNYLPQMSIYG
ncbi:NUDIX hydrolase [Paenibacillus sp. L3-i20]|uniref:NUDIX domain-containing protein n=1 Tax=Paenibacillus sp. L3-i20 TaxID=2905833 RepID=UPI001EDD3344|nr:NUDIX hydrolase [Paenibacillus sp. L3-i20]GKU78431.1 ADP-ribose pyrophosphatase [Paenibacillus sp. L3-i20]